MIVEVGLFRIDPQRSSEFEGVAKDIRDVFGRGVDGLRFFELRSAIEDRGRWAVLAGWDAVEDHRRFVGSPEGERQRDLLSGFMIGEPEVFHMPFRPSGVPWA
jgi:hypothetical protein